MSTTLQSHRVLSDTTNILRPSRRICAAVPKATLISQSSTTSHRVSEERSKSPLPQAAGHAVQPSQQPSPSPMSIPQMYDRMNVLMLEMNMLMAQWETAANSQQDSTATPPTDLFKGMLGAFGGITNWYLQQQQQHQHLLQQQLQQQQQQLIAPRQPSPIVTVQHSIAERTVTQSEGRSQSGSPDLDRECIFAVIEFKRQRMKRYLCDQFVEPGQYVLVDADRGQDCGFVVYCSVRNADGSLGRTQCIEGLSLEVARVKADHGIVRGLASKSDIALLHGELAADERMGLKICRDLVEQMGFAMDVIDCEYQFDRRKISFYFESSRSIDFRPLTNELFRIFGVRIWLENQNNKVKNVVPDGPTLTNNKTRYACQL